MAGGHAPVKVDPAVEAWASMRENVYKSFKFTSKTTRTSLVFAVAVPLVTYYVFSEQDGTWDWKGKKRSDSLRAQQSTTAATSTTQSS